MASGFWVVLMTDRAREISAFITPRMHFGLKNAPQMYQRLVDNALSRDPATLGLQRTCSGPVSRTILIASRCWDGDHTSTRRSYIDDIMIAAESWDQMCRRVEDLLEACDKWNLSISVAKRFWGMDKVGYLGHRVSIGGLEASPKT
ncbi:reverse transcriptase [Phytophthora megakarya]|uniref:Reverse transcriptase n=1 Tax=Phytophthora megakarya TaxID=4795 RepID=A0A225UF77_9STRA|nr:reverse transcriptase [Phytophthora megakarya]